MIKIFEVKVMMTENGKNDDFEHLPTFVTENPILLEALSNDKLRGVLLDAWNAFDNPRENAERLGRLLFRAAQFVADTTPADVRRVLDSAGDRELAIIRGESRLQIPVNS